MDGLTDFGDSWKLNRRNRAPKMRRVMQPRTMNRYRQPMLDPRVQHGVSPVPHGGRSVEHEYFGTIPNEMTEATTTPIGWKKDRAASRNRRFVGRNSRVMVASIGMLPPTPKPLREGDARRGRTRELELSARLGGDATERTSWRR